MACFFWFEATTYIVTFRRGRSMRPNEQVSCLAESRSKAPEVSAFTGRFAPWRARAVSLHRDIFTDRASRLRFLLLLCCFANTRAEISGHQTKTELGRPPPVRCSKAAETSAFTGGFSCRPRVGTFCAAKRGHHAMAGCFRRTTVAQFLLARTPSCAWPSVVFHLSSAPTGPDL